MIGLKDLAWSSQMLTMKMMYGIFGPMIGMFMHHHERRHPVMDLFWAHCWERRCLPSRMNTNTFTWWHTDFYVDSVGQEEQFGYTHALSFINDGAAELKENFPVGQETVVEE